MPSPLEHVITCPLCNTSLRMKRDQARAERARQEFLKRHLDDCTG